METRLKIEGMHCGGCAGSVKRALEGEEGVESAEVSLEAGEARVRYPEGSVHPERLCELVERAGYAASVAG